MSTPRAVFAHELGAPETFSLEPHDPGAPGAGQVRIKIHALGISYFDVLMAAGKYQVRPPLPFIPGSECGAVVESIGEGVTGFKPGDRVLVYVIGGLLSEAAVVSTDVVWRIPDRMSFEDASIFLVSYATVYHALVQRAALAPGETVLVLGAGGAIGYAAVQVAKALGARVIASASTETKRSLAVEGGADAVVDSRSSTWREDVKAQNDGRGVDVVVDPLGGDAAEPAFRSLAWKGRHLVIGFAAGGIPRIPANVALLKGASLVGVDLRQFGIFEPEQARANVDALFELYDRGLFAPRIAKTYPIEEFAAAMNEAATGETAGRVVVTMN